MKIILILGNKLLPSGKMTKILKERLDSGIKYYKKNDIFLVSGGNIIFLTSVLINSDRLQQRWRGLVFICTITSSFALLFLTWLFIIINSRHLIIGLVLHLWLRSRTFIRYRFSTYVGGRFCRLQKGRNSVILGARRRSRWQTRHRKCRSSTFTSGN